PHGVRINLEFGDGNKIVVISTHVQSPAPLVVVPPRSRPRCIAQPPRAHLRHSHACHKSSIGSAQAHGSRSYLHVNATASYRRSPHRYRLAQSRHAPTTQRLSSVRVLTRSSPWENSC